MRFDLQSFEFVALNDAPQALAVVGSDRTLTWAQLRHEAMAWARQASACGVLPNMPVVIHGHKEAAFMVAMTGALLLGAPFVPVDTIYPAERLRRIVDIVGAAAVYDASRASFSYTASNPIPLIESDLAYVMFTSGSTGDPKGVQIGRESVALLAEWMTDFGLGQAPVFMNQAPFSFDLSMYEVFGTLAFGGAVVMNAREQIAASPQYLSRLATYGVRCWVSTPSFTHQQLVNRDFSPSTLPTLDTFLFCGEPLTSTLAKRLRQRFPQAQILNTYGPTEATVATTAVVVDDALLAAHDALPIGYAKPLAQVYVDQGELCIVGDHVMRGYLNRPDLNMSKLFYSKDGQRGFRTGDLGEQDEITGLLFCRGRMDDQIKLNGYRIELSEIDAALNDLPDVREGACIVLRRPDGAAVRVIGFVADGISPMAFAAAHDCERWKAHLAERLPHYMVPSELLRCAVLPVSNNHKIDRKQLLDMYGSINS